MSEQQKFRWWTSPRNVLRHILMLQDSAHSIALGTAIGVFLGMTPTVGIQMLLVVVLAAYFYLYLRSHRARGATALSPAEAPARV